MGPAAAKLAAIAAEVDSAHRRRLCSEACAELCLRVESIRERKGDGRRAVERRLEHDHVVNLRRGRMQDRVILPATAAVLRGGRGAGGRGRQRPKGAGEAGDGRARPGSVRASGTRPNAHGDGGRGGVVCAARSPAGSRWRRASSTAEAASTGRRPGAAGSARVALRLACEASRRSGARAPGDGARITHRTAAGAEQPVAEQRGQSSGGRAACAREAPRARLGHKESAAGKARCGDAHG